LKRKRHTPEQIIHKLRQADAELAAGQPIAAICQKLRVAEATFHRWRNQYGGMKAVDARRLAAPTGRRNRCVGSPRFASESQRRSSARA
jgi:transposase-like protein